MVLGFGSVAAGLGFMAVNGLSCFVVWLGKVLRAFRFWEVTFARRWR